MKESKFIENIRLEFQKRYEGRLFKRVTGFLRTPDGRPVRVNSAGQADLDGFVLVGGVPCYLCVEAKTGSVPLSEVQRKRKMAFEGMGVLYHVVRERSFLADMEELDRLIREVYLRKIRSDRCE